MRLTKNGFSLIELLMVVAIMGILAAVGLVSYKAANMKARDARRAADIQQVRSALEMYRADNDKYPTSDDDWKGLMKSIGKYLGGQKELVDPLNNDPYIYKYDSDGTTYTLTYYSEVKGGAAQTFKNP